MAPTKWSYTLGDFPDLVRPIMAQRDADPSDPLTLVHAPCCGRVTPADTIVDLRAISGTVIAGGGHRPPADLDWACDGCLHRLYADEKNAWTKASLLEARGAPAALVAEHRTRERAFAEQRAAFTRDGCCRPGDIYERVRADVDREHRDRALAEAWPE